MEAPRLRSMLDKHAGGNFGADRDRDVSAESGVSNLLPRSRQTAASSNSACRYFGLSVLVLAFFIGAATPALLKSTSIWQLYDRTSKSVSEVVGTFDFDFDFASHDDVDEPVPPTLPDLPEQGQDEPDDEMEVQDPTKPPPAPRPVATVSKASPKGAPAKGIAASKQGGGGGGVALVEIEAVKHCGVSYRPEPQTRALKEGNHKCRCTAASCEDLDNPSMTYIVHVEAKSLSTAVLQASLRKAFTSIRSHMDVNRGPSFETFVSMPAPERASTAKAVFAAFLKAAAIVEPKGKNSWEATMARSSIVFRDAASVASTIGGEESYRASLAPLYRAANAREIAVARIDENGNAVLDAAQLRDDAMRSYSSDGKECGKDDIDFSFAIQYFRRPSLINAIVGALKKLKIDGEILVNDDSASEIDVWLTGMSKGSDWPFYLLVSGNVHEIRGYNRLAKMARGKHIVFMQDDDVPPPTPRWILHATSLFRKNSKLGILAGFTGTIQGGPLTGKYGVQKDAIKYRSSFQRRPFMFVTLANMGPMIFRRTAFHELGMFSGNFSCRSEPGIGFDYEMSLRMWYYGYSVGIFDTEFKYAVGQAGSGTRANRGLYRARQNIERRNSRYHKAVYGPGRGALNFYIRQGLPGTPSAKSTPRSGVRGVGKLVHEANEALASTPSKF
ncbi:glycosyltransferase 2-like domain-containing protein [Pseudoscourfieldia marina]